MRECDALLLTKGQEIVSVNPGGRAKSLSTFIAVTRALLQFMLYFT